MKRKEQLLVILMEECGELAQDTAKALRFGIEEQRDLPTTNRERMQKEFNDILAVVDRLNDECDLDLHRDPKLIREKHEKMDRYMAYSEALGTLETA